MSDDEKDTEPTETHIFIRGEGGGIFKLDLPLHETIADRLAKGVIVRVANKKGDPYVGSPEAPKAPEPPKERPAVSANKPEWVAWAIVNGMSEADADASTKDDLIEKFGNAAPVAPSAGQGDN